MGQLMKCECKPQCNTGFPTATGQAKLKLVV